MVNELQISSYQTTIKDQKKKLTGRPLSRSDIWQMVINKNIWVDMGTSLKLMNPNLDVGRITVVIELKGNGRLEAIVLVENHNATTFLAVINEWIKPGTTIISDCWKVIYFCIHLNYKCNKLFYFRLTIPTLNDEGYTQMIVNHSLHLKDPVQVCIQTP